MTTARHWHASVLFALEVAKCAGILQNERVLKYPDLPCQILITYFKWWWWLAFYGHFCAQGRLNGDEAKSKTKQPFRYAIYDNLISKHCMRWSNWLVLTTPNKVSPTWMIFYNVGSWMVLWHFLKKRTYKSIAEAWRNLSLGPFLFWYEFDEWRKKKQAEGYHRWNFVWCRCSMLFLLLHSSKEIPEL